MRPKLKKYRENGARNSEQSSYKNINSDLCEYLQIKPDNNRLNVPEILLRGAAS